jgi:hypothetical protein
MNATSRRSEVMALKLVSASSEGRYVVEFATVVEQAMVLDFAEDLASNDVDVCRARARALQAGDSAGTRVVLIWDRACGHEVPID